MSTDENGEKLVKCIVCKKSLCDWSSKTNKDGIQPMGGLEFFTYGHYGSTVFDPIYERKRLHVCICDECVVEGVKAGTVGGSIDDVYMGDEG